MINLLSPKRGNRPPRLPLAPGFDATRPKSPRRPWRRVGLRQAGRLGSIFVLVVLAAMVLVSVGPRFLGYSSVVVYGGSMAPAVPRGSVAVGKPVDASSLAVGDIVVYQASGAKTPTLHRITAIDIEGKERVFTTKGDANEEADPARLHLTGRGARVVYSIPYAGFLLHARSTSWGRVLFVWLPAMLLLTLVLWTVWRPAGRPRDQAPAEDKGLLSIGS